MPTYHEIRPGSTPEKIIKALIDGPVTAGYLEEKISTPIRIVNSAIRRLLKDEAVRVWAQVPKQNTRPVNVYALNRQHRAVVKVLNSEVSK